MGIYPKRKAQRLKNYDYSLGGAYFITICTHQKQRILSEIIGDKTCSEPIVRLSETGKKVEEALLHISARYPKTALDQYVIMPNHVHFVIFKYDDIEPLSQIIAGFKSYTTYLFGKQLWQKSYYDHIIRSSKDYNEIIKYIFENPARWAYDKYY